MSLLILNDTAISAYSVCFTSGIATMHAHFPGDNFDFYQSISHPNAIWLYVPVHGGEWVSQIWKRSGLDRRDQALMVRVSIQRVS